MSRQQGHRAGAAFLWDPCHHQEARMMHINVFRTVTRPILRPILFFSIIERWLHIQGTPSKWLLKPRSDSSASKTLAIAAIEAFSLSISGGCGPQECGACHPTSLRRAKKCHFAVGGPCSAAVEVLLPMMQVRTSSCLASYLEPKKEDASLKFCLELHELA